MRASPAAILLGAIVLSVQAVEPRTAAQSPAALPRESVALPHDALAQARASGRARVIVRLQIDVRPEAGLPPRAVAAQRAAIARDTAALLGRLGRAGDPAVKRFTVVPYVALEATEPELLELARAPEVSGIETDALARATLANSTLLVGAAPHGADTGAGWSVAILDTGVDAAHPFLWGRVASEACYSANLCPDGGTASTAPGAGSPCGLAGCWHGTHVAGIAAGAGAGFSGVAPGAALITIQVFSRFDSPDICYPDPVPCIRSYTSDQMRALERVYALRHSVAIAAVNLSLGGALYSQPCEGDSRKALVDQLRAAGIATVASSGNDGSTAGIASPACISTVVSVGSSTSGASGPADLMSAFSNRNAWLTMVAPGQTITSSVPGGQFAAAVGTSMAAPHVAGALAVLKGRAPWLGVDEAITALTSTGRPIVDPPSGRTYPRLDLRAALASLAPPPCDFSAAPPRLTAPAAGGVQAIAVTAPPGCGWTAVSTVPWITLQDGPRTGPATVILVVSRNPGRARRAGTVVVAGRHIPVYQRGAAAEGDITGNGRADIVWQHAAGGTIALWQLDGPRVVSTEWFSIAGPGDPAWRVAGSGDLDGDGVADLVWQHAGDGRLAAWFLQGTQVVATVPLSIGQVADRNWTIRGVADVDGDGCADLLWQHGTNGGLAAWFMNGADVTGTEFLSLPQVTDLQWQIAGAGDLDGDGKADLVWQHHGSGQLAAWLLDGARVVGTVPLSVPATTDPRWKIRGVGDANGDGFADLLWQHEATGWLGTWFMRGTTVIEQWGLSINRVTDLAWTIVGPG